MGLDNKIKIWVSCSKFRCNGLFFVSNSGGKTAAQRPQKYLSGCVQSHNEPPPPPPPRRNKGPPHEEKCSYMEKKNHSIPMPAGVSIPSPPAKILIVNKS